MAKKHFVNPNYNWYSNELHPDVQQKAQENGVIGWTGENEIYQGTPSGKPIYPGFKENPHLTTQADHRKAASSLHARAKRIQEAISSQQISPEELPIVQKELADIENQKTEHIRHSLNLPSAATNKPAMAKSRSSCELLKSLRGKKASQRIN